MQLPRGYAVRDSINKKPLKTVWPDCKAATKFEKTDLE